MPHPGGIQRLYRPRADLSALAHRKWMPSVNVTGGLNCVCNTHWLQFAETDVTLSAFHVWHSDRPAGAETWLQPLLHRGTTFTEQLLSSAAASLSLLLRPASDGRGSEEGSGLSLRFALKGRVFITTFTIADYLVSKRRSTSCVLSNVFESQTRRRFFLILLALKNKNLN